jgi:hypothetical protein
MTKGKAILKIAEDKSEKTPPCWLSLVKGVFGKQSRYIPFYFKNSHPRSSADDASPSMNKKPNIRSVSGVGMDENRCSEVLEALRVQSKPNVRKIMRHTYRRPPSLILASNVLSIPSCPSDQRATIIIGYNSNTDVSTDDSKIWVCQQFADELLPATSAPPHCSEHKTTAWRSAIRGTGPYSAFPQDLSRCMQARRGRFSTSSGSCKWWSWQGSTVIAKYSANVRGIEAFNGFQDPR